MLSVDILIGFPLPRQKWILPADNLAIEERRQRREFFRQTFDFQIPTQISILLVDMLKKN